MLTGADTYVHARVVPRRVQADARDVCVHACAHAHVHAHANVRTVQMQGARKRLAAYLGEYLLLSNV